MKVTAWNSGKHLESGAGYGLKLNAKDRDEFFDKNWTIVLLQLPEESEPIEVNIAKKSFWNNTCRELISKEIGLWLRSTDLAPWPTGKPPKLELTPTGHNTFRIE